MTHEQELSVIRRVLDGDINCFEDIVKDNQKMVYNLALHMTGNQQDAEDIAQDTFFSAYKALNTYKGECKFSVWLYRIASNKCIDFLRSRKDAGSLTEENAEGEEIQRDIPDDSASPESIMMQGITRESIRSGIMTLPEDQRTAFLLRELKGLSYDEIAEATGTDKGTVKTRIFRARKKLCVYLAADGNFSELISSMKSRGGERG